MKVQITLDPPLSDENITMENHSYVDLEIECDNEQVLNWFKENMLVVNWRDRLVIESQGDRYINCSNCGHLEMI